MPRRSRTLALCSSVALLAGACASAPGVGPAPSEGASTAPTALTTATAAPRGGSTSGDLAAASGTVASDGWKITTAPFLWLFDIDGSVSKGGRTLPVSAHLSDAIDLATHDLEFAFAGHFEAARGDWAVFLDANYLDIASEASASASVLRGVGVASADVEVNSNLAIVELGAAYRVGEFPGACDRPAPVELVGGARWNHLDVDFDLGTSLALPRRTFERQFSLDGGSDWVDPFVGVRTQVPLAENVSLLLRGDIGGGIGSGSDRAWNAVVGLSIRCGETTDAFVGWRWYDFERSISGRDTDLQLSGPGIGVVMRF